ncbi:MAG: ABC transporter ATP-binding protein [Acidobacteriota bacterium]
MDERLIIEIEKELAGCRLAINLSIAAEIFVLFGPSGSGKTQTLHALAGLMAPDRGQISLDGHLLFNQQGNSATVNLPARRRRMAMVFQQYALFPHLTARQNIAFPLRGDRRAADRLLERMQLEALADRYPHELSGGQQQRVAIARALAADAQVLLLDEPFSALDRPIRDQLHRELIALQEETGLVVVYVTHSLDDALTAGHRMAIINQGRIEQVSGLSEIFTRPRSRAVLEIIGVPNLFDGLCDDGSLNWDGLQLRLSDSRARMSGRIVSAYIPAEEVRVEADRLSLGESVNRFPARIVRSQSSGLTRRIWMELPNGRTIETAVRHGGYFSPGEMVEVSIPPERIICVDDNG